MITIQRFLILVSVLIFTLIIPTSVSADGCIAITQAPNLYQIDRVGTNSTLYFTPVNVQTTSYTIVYGTQPNDEQNSVDVAYGDSTGAISYTIGDLEPNTHYYYEVRANNDCSNGPYSSWVGEVQKSSSDSSGNAQGGVSSQSGTTKPPVTGSLPPFLPLVLSFGAMGVGGMILLKSRHSF